MTVRAADPHDIDGLLALAAEVEHLFGPMVADPAFHAALHRTIARATALVAESGGTLTGASFTA
ncbi:hypothetical protein [Catenuloplanes japonicus]|uniref:hypothetical protein n=1 Tax=Catenuloplanes japonicus TaxID=33876 RepID=UPI000A95CAE0|nr:hypothetical protein [Catenuloplanes japonicus]